MALVQQIIESKIQSQIDGGSHFVKDIQTLHCVHQWHYHRLEQ